MTTIEDFSSAYSFLTFTGSESWIIEATFTEDDVGFEIGDVRYDGEDSYYSSGILYITFTE